MIDCFVFNVGIKQIEETAEKLKMLAYSPFTDREAYDSQRFFIYFKPNEMDLFDCRDKIIKDLNLKIIGEHRYNWNDIFEVHEYTWRSAKNPYVYLHFESMGTEKLKPLEQFHLQEIEKIDQYFQKEDIQLVPVKLHRDFIIGSKYRGKNLVTFSDPFFHFAPKLLWKERQSNGNFAVNPERLAKWNRQFNIWYKINKKLFS